MAQCHVQVASDQIKDFCKKHGIQKLSFFGSVLRDDFGPDSDVDILVEFVPGTRVGFIRLAGMEQELSVLIGRKVDLRTPAELSRYFRDDVLRTAKVEYAQEGR
jgi:predicted nucleotidyltransferase